MVIPHRASSKITLHSRKKANILGIADPDTRIYRVFTLDRLFDTIVGKQLALVRPRLWEDPFENLLYQTPLQDADGNPVSIERLRNRLYGQCWTLASVSDALWRIYSPYKIGVRVRTTVGKLLNAIWKDDRFDNLKYFIGKVEYHSQAVLLKKFQDPLTHMLDATGRGPVMSLLLKRTAFQHEREVRLIFHDTQDSKDQVVYCPIDPNSIFETLLFDPRMDSKTVATFSWVLKEIGFNNKVSQSELYNAPSLKSHIV